MPFNPLIEVGSGYLIDRGLRNKPQRARQEVVQFSLVHCEHEERLTPKFRGARLAWPKRAVVEASPATPS